MERTAPEEATLVSLDPFVLSGSPFQFFMTSHLIVALDIFISVSLLAIVSFFQKERKGRRETETRKNKK